MSRVSKSVIGLITALLFLLSQNIPVLAVSSNDYKDISGNWAETQITDLINLGIMDGYEDNTIRPNNFITRAEFAKILLEALDISIDVSSSKEYFKDVKPEDWYYAPITILKERSIIDGYDDGTFRPKQNITRAEMLAMLVRISKDKLKMDKSSKLFKDVTMFHWAYWDIYRAAKAGLIAKTGILLRPDEFVTRAEVAYSIDKMLWNQRSNVSEETVINFAKQYNSIVNLKYNTNDTNMDDLISMSYGGQLYVLNSLAKRNEFYKNAGIKIDRTVNLYNPYLGQTSYNLAKVSFEYDLTKKIFFKNSINTINKKGLLTYFLKNYNGKWLVYREEDIPVYNKFREQNIKINLVWDYVGCPIDYFKGGKIEGLDVISPTWFNLADSQGNIENRASSEYVTWAHNNGYQVWALVSNKFDSELTSQVLRNSIIRKKVIDTLVKYVDDYRLDGINIDFENMNTRDKDLFTQFIRELSIPLKTRGVILSVDVTVIDPNSSWSKCYDRKALANIVDYVAVMTYDQHWSTSPISGSVAQITWVEKGIKNILNEVPNEKLLLGLPFYTREWKETSGPNGIEVTSRVISMEEAEKLIRDNNAKKIWDSESGQYFVQYSKDGATYKIWLEDEHSIDLKSQLVNKYNLAGVASWRAGFEKSEIWPVLKKNLNK